jgi:hypothetical protein
LGCHLTTLFGNAAITATATVIPAVPVQRKKHNMLPVLVVLFLISYGLMTMLIIEQGRTIESQRALIHELYHDSAELAAVKSRTLQDSAVVDTQHALAVQAPSSHNSSHQIQPPSTQAQVPNTRIPSAQIPSTHTSSTQTPTAQMQSSKTPSTQIPSTQVAPRGRVKNRGAKMPEPQFQAPSRPSADLADERRALRTI